MDSKQKRIIIDIQLGRKNLNSGLKKIRDEWDFKSIEQGIEQIIKINTVSGRQLKTIYCHVHKDHSGVRYTKNAIKKRKSK